VKPSRPPTIPVRDVAVKKEVAAPVNVYAPPTAHGEAGGSDGGEIGGGNRGGDGGGECRSRSTTVSPSARDAAT